MIENVKSGLVKTITTLANRVLCGNMNLAEALNGGGKMKKNIKTIVLAALLVFPVAACENEAPPAAPEEQELAVENATQVVETAKPMQEYTSLAKAEKSTGIICPLPELLPEGYLQTKISSIVNEAIQITYAKNDKKILYRVAKAEKNNDEAAASDDKILPIAELDVLVKSENGLVTSAAWLHSGQNYIVYFDEPVDEDFLSRFIESIPLNESADGKAK